MFAPIIAYTGSYLTARLADQGLANTLGLVTLRHGTNPISWLGIHILGAKPSMGASKFGGDAASYAFATQNKNRFYLAHDSDYFYSNTSSKNLEKYFPNKIQIRVLPRQYACWSTNNLILSICGIKTGPLPYLIGLALPVIKFRFPHEKVITFIEDRSIDDNAACSTDQYISPLNIGLLGTLWNGISIHTPKRIFKHKVRVLVGLAELAFCAAVAYLAITHLAMFIAAHKTAVLAGAFFALV